MAVADLHPSTVTIENAKVKIGPFATKDLFVDPTYQRIGKEHRVTHMAENWDPNLVGLLELSARVDGSGRVIKYAVIDGGTRLAAAREATARGLRNIEFLDGKATWGYDLQTEARLFSAINYLRTPVHVVERFKADVVAGTEPAVTIQKALNDAGMRVDYGTSPTSIAAVRVLEQIYWWGSLPVTLRVITEAWGPHNEARKQNPLQAVAAFDRCYQEEGYDEGRLIAGLARTYPDALLSQARLTVKESSYTGRSVWAEMAKLITNIYNGGVGKNTKYPRLATRAEGMLPRFERPDLPRAKQKLTKGNNTRDWRIRRAKRRAHRESQAPEEKASADAQKLIAKAKKQLAAR